jgi:UDP:flavonoid glycosyltransferase YjiC (YdhE family)
MTHSTHSARVFFFLSGGWGPLVRTLPIAHRLVDLGVASSFAIGGTLGAQIRAAGYDLVALSLPEAGMAAGAASERWSPYHFLSDHNADSGRLIAHVEAYRQAISKERPAVVITDINPLAALAAKSLRIPHVTISQSLFLPFRKLQSDKWAIPSALPAINKVLAHYGVTLLESAEYLDAGDITLIPSIPEFDPTQNSPASVHYIGPILGNELVPLAAPDREIFTSGVPEVLFYPGRPRDAVGASGQALAKAGLTALSALDVTVTVSTGGYHFDVPDCLGRRIEIVPWRIISPGYKPSLILHHGGHGACLTAITSGIPSAIVPTHAEREYNATNLAALGCGELVPTGEIAVESIRRLIENVLGNPVFLGECRRWSRTIAARNYEGADRAARIITHMIAERAADGHPA